MSLRHRTAHSSTSSDPISKSPRWKHVLKTRTTTSNTGIQKMTSNTRKIAFITVA